MRYIDPHIHMVSRTTDDYTRMAQAGCVAGHVDDLVHEIDRERMTEAIQPLRSMVGEEGPEARRHGGTKGPSEPGRSRPD